MVLTKKRTTPEAPARAAIRRALLRWYDRHKRDLPWRRRQKCRYAQWVAEIMLQQTRVETVLAYYDRFLARFPSVHVLARARRQSVLKHWEGLGYYRRARLLHDGARWIVRSRKGTLPETAEQWQEVPGVGRYTAAAIASISRSEAVAAVDGNVTRIMTRMFGLGADASRKTVEHLASTLLSPSRPGDHNQAWMDLGSSLCGPRSVRCARCPVRRWCKQSAGGDPRPAPAKMRSHKKRVRAVACVIRSDDRILVRRRPDEGLWAGLWEVPNVVRQGGDWRSERIARWLGTTGPLVHAGTVTHELTHQTWHFDVYHGQANGVGEADGHWLTRRQLARRPVSRAMQRVIALGSRAGDQ